VSATRLQHFLHATDQPLHVSAALRDCVVLPDTISRMIHPVRLDFVSCHNAFTRLAPESRTKLYSLLHFALNEGGHLLLGPAETFTPSVDCFSLWTWRAISTGASVRRTSPSPECARGLG